MSEGEREKMLEFEEAVMALLSSICLEIVGSGGDSGTG